MFSRHVLSGVLMFYLFLFSVFYLPWLSHVSYIQTLCYNILIHINIIMATCKQSRFDITGLKLHHASFVFSAPVIFCKWLLLLLFKPNGLYVWLIIKKTSNIHVFIRNSMMMRWCLFNQHLTPRTTYTLFKFFLTTLVL